MVDAPEKPSDRRPNDEPYFIDSECECGAELVYYDAESGWFDEFECPSCQDGIRMDVPESWWSEIEDRAEQ